MQKIFAINEESIKEINKYLRTGWKIKTGGTFIPGTFVTLTLDMDELANLRLMCERCQSGRKACATCLLADRMKQIQACIMESGSMYVPPENTFKAEDFEEGVML